MSTSVKLHSRIYSSSANMSSSMSRAGHGARHWGTAPASPLWSLWPQRFRPMNDEHRARGDPGGVLWEHGVSASPSRAALCRILGKDAPSSTQQSCRARLQISRALRLVPAVCLHQPTFGWALMAEWSPQP